MNLYCRSCQTVHKLADGQVEALVYDLHQGYLADCLLKQAESAVGTQWVNEAVAERIRIEHDWYATTGEQL